MGHLYYLKHAKRYFSKKPELPLYLVYFISDRCNARCKHCLLADGAHVPDLENELKLEEIEKIATSLKGLLFLLPTGGEPFMRKDIGEIIKIFYKNAGVRNVGIPTNGTFTSRVINVVTDVMESCPELDLGIDVSLDGIGQVHDQVRGVPGIFKNATTTFQELRKLEKKYKRLNVNIETTVSSFNEDHLMENYRYFVDKLGANTVFTLLTRGSPSDPASKFFDIEKYQRYAAEMEKGIKEGILSGYYNFPFCDIINAKRVVRHQLIAKLVKENRFQIPCYAGNLGAAMFAKGDIYPCELHTDMKLGNIRDYNYNFSDIWFTPQAEEARKKIIDGKCFCTYECFLTFNILFNPKMSFRIIKEWAQIKMAKLTKNGAA